MEAGKANTTPISLNAGRSNPAVNTSNSAALEQANEQFLERKNYGVTETK
jgi:hypothetical protein